MADPHRRRVTWLLGLALFTVGSLAASAQSVQPSDTVTQMAAEFLTIQNVILVAGLVFHFGLLRQELRQLRADVNDLEAWRQKRPAEADAVYARREVIAEHIASIDRRLGLIEQALSERRK